MMPKDVAEIYLVVCCGLLGKRYGLRFPLWMAFGVWVLARFIVTA
jgi:hypothetical protein